MAFEEMPAVPIGGVSRQNIYDVIQDFFETHPEIFAGFALLDSKWLQGVI